MDRKCPVYITLKFLGRRWALPIVVELYKGKAKWKRYSQIKGKLMDITPKILSMRLKELEEQRLLRKRVDAKTFPIKSEYSLTRRGEELLDVVRALKTWGLKWKVKNEYCKKVNCKHCKL